MRDHISLRLHMHAVESTKSGLAGAGAIDCCPEPSVHDWETGCEVTRQDGTIRGSWAFPFRWTTFCWSARDFCSLLEDEGREKGRGQGPDGDCALLLRQILVELLPVGGRAALKIAISSTTTLIQRRHLCSSLFHLQAQLQRDEAMALLQKPVPVDALRDT